MAFDWSPYLQRHFNQGNSGFDSGLYTPGEWTAPRLNDSFFFEDIRPMRIGEGGMIEDMGGGGGLKAAPAGLTAREVVARILQDYGQVGAGGILGRLGNAGYFNQFADWPEIAPVVGEIAAGSQSLVGSGGLEDMVKGVYIHGKNIAGNYLDNPEQLLTAGAFGPVGSKYENDLWGNDQDASNQWGQPSEQTYGEMQSRGISDTGSTQWMHDIGKMAGLSIASAAAGGGFGAGNAAANAAGTAAAAGNFSGAAGAAGAGAGAYGGFDNSAVAGGDYGLGATPSGAGGTVYAQGGNTMTDVPLIGGGPQMPPAQALNSAELTQMGLTEVSPGYWVQGAGSSMPAATAPSTAQLQSMGMEEVSPGVWAQAGTETSGAGWADFMSKAVSNPQVIGALGGALIGGLGSRGSDGKTVETEEGIPDWLMPYVKPTLDKYSTDIQNYNVDPYGIMPSAMQEFKNTVGGMYLDPSTNKYLEDYFRLGAERIKGSLSPSFGHMQAFGQHSGYNEALSRGLGDYAVGLYGGAYEKERDRQNQMIAASPAFLGQSTAANFSPYQEYLKTIGSLGRKKEEPYFQPNQWQSILGGALAGSQIAGAFK